MPRLTKRVDLQYDREKIQEYLSKIGNGTMSIKKAAKESGILYSTLRDRTSEKADVDARPGASTVLTAEEELQLHDYLIKLSELASRENQRPSAGTGLHDY